MEDEEVKALIKSANNIVRVSIVVSLFTMGLAVVNINPEFFGLGEEPETELAAPIEEDRNLIIEGIHVRTGLIDAEGMNIVIANCTNCHSAKLVTQNRMTAERWNETIKWMQETQNLWELGDNQEIIVNYLVTNYPPNKSGSRRTNLTNIEWYETEN